jgi:hypothetical protein
MLFPDTVERSQKYLALLLKRIEVCKRYKPKFGQGSKNGLSLSEFQQLYQSDPFYAWFGLDNPLMYAAHKAAGGITSVYRQLGTGCEEVFRQILRDQFDLNLVQSTWFYQMSTNEDKKRKLSLDGRVELSDIKDNAKQEQIKDWLLTAASQVGVAPEITKVLKGAVFEVRQGYKSKDSKRQNADIANAAMAYSQGYLPVVVVLSTQMDSDIITRYKYEKWLILLGSLSGANTQSTYTFVEQVLGFDLANFFRQNSPTLKLAIDDVLKALLETHG